MLTLRADPYAEPKLCVGRRTSAHRRTRPDSDALPVTVLTMLATIVAEYDLLLLGAHIQS
ncbi:MAG TPA: hypothetical protein VFV91_09880 [Gaiellaceae bacterium]|nr:hypothetical protein [Gaiellaceae bacterium]